MLLIIKVICLIINSHVSCLRLMHSTTTYLSSYNINAYEVQTEFVNLHLTQNAAVRAQMPTCALALETSASKDNENRHLRLLFLDYGLALTCKQCRAQSLHLILPLWTYMRNLIDVIYRFYVIQCITVSLFYHWRLRLRELNGKGEVGNSWRKGRSRK